MELNVTNDNFAFEPVETFNVYLQVVGTDSRIRIVSPEVTTVNIVDDDSNDNLSYSFHIHTHTETCRHTLHVTWFNIVYLILFTLNVSIYKTCIFKLLRLLGN